MTYSFKAPKMKAPVVGPSAIPSIPEIPKLSVKDSTFVTKWLPFICAGTAVGVSVLALKELKKIKSEMVVLKNQPTNVKDPELSKKMDRFELELKKMNEFLMNNNGKNPKIIKNILKSQEQTPKKVKIINEPEEDNVEYEEVEVTDDEQSDDEDETQDLKN
jgi:hypothetical protein